MKLNKNYKHLGENYLFAEVSKRVEAYKSEFPNSDIISLGIGDVTQPLSAKVSEACREAGMELSTKTGFHGYGPYDGYPFLKNAIVAYYKKRGIEINPDEVFVTDGAKDALGAFLDLFDVSNTVMIPDPVYPAYVDANVMDGRKIIYVDGTRENGFLPMPPKAKADIIYLCSPNNPTGAAYTAEQLNEWVQYALDNEAVILYDAAYEAFVEDGKKAARSIFEVTGARDCAVEFCSLSKLAGFTGVRCGWTVIPMASPLNRMFMRRQATKFNGTSYVVQRMAASALSGAGLEETMKSVAVYKSNAKIITDKFDALGIEYVGGKNAPYVWFYCGIDSWEFFDYLLKKARVVVTPGSGFGKNGEGWLRITSFNTPERTQEAMKRFEAFWKEYVEVKGKLFKVIK
ncbi:MAG: LL-diaminopimelate aminotransferase [Clostridiales bacterium]|nr:LL-diaminopimelate aminotransferase [Clostridiales bacterium]